MNKNRVSKPPKIAGGACSLRRYEIIVGKFHINKRIINFTSKLESQLLRLD